MNLSYLDRILNRRGVRQLKNEFNTLARQNRKKALMQINSAETGFPVLFLLSRELERMKMTDGLNTRNLSALNFLNEINGAEDAFEEECGRCGPPPEWLNWIFVTGVLWEPSSGISSGYDSVIDSAAARLVINYNYKRILPDIAELIFRRNRTGRMIHDLTWVLFQTAEAKVLLQIAEHLISANERDAKLARLLLHLPELTENVEKVRQYDMYASWLNENQPYLYLTGEHFNMTSAPESLKCDLEAKYLCREISPLDRSPKEPLNAEEFAYLARFRRVAEQELLSDYSCKLHKSDMHAWREWMQMDIAEQVFSARSESEGL